MGCCASERDAKNKANDEVSAQEGGLFSQRLNEIYKKYDINHDGSLDRKETRNLLNTVLKEQGRTVSDKDLEDFIDAADSNRDGKIQKR